MSDSISYNSAFTDDAVYLKLEPMLDSEANWAGGVGVSSIVPEDFPFEGPELASVMGLLNLSAVAIHLIETDDVIYKRVLAFIEETPEFFNQTVVEETAPDFSAVVESVEDNVVKVAFGKEGT
tara:strand:- start:469 stop:837 length:369 start_codon:yes stop_codon:yes gene_type:complete